VKEDTSICYDLVYFPILFGLAGSFQHLFFGSASEEFSLFN